MPRDRRTRRDLHGLDADGMVICNPRDREAAHRAEMEGIATDDHAAVTCRACLEILHRLARERRPGPALPSGRPAPDGPGVDPSPFPAAWDAADGGVRHPFVRLLRDLSALAYLDQPEGDDRLGALLPVPRPGGTLLTGSGMLPMHAWVVPVDGDAVVAFRGSQSLASWIQDLRVIGRSTPEGRLHGGFASGYDGLHDPLVTRLRRAGAGRVWLTGHSLGGALAVVAAMRLAEAGVEIAGVVTFGQPRVCLGGLAERVGPRLHRKYLAFVNAADPVPRMVLPYVHFGWRVTFDGNRCERTDTGPSPRLARAGSPAAADAEGMSPEELDALIAALDGPAEGTSASGDERRVTGMLVDRLFGDHALERYADAVDAYLAPAGFGEAP